MELELGQQDWIWAALMAVFFAYAFHVLFPTEEKLPDGPGGGIHRKMKKNSIFLKIFGGPIEVLGAFLSTIPMEDYRERLRTQLIAAGSPGNLSVDEYNASRIIGVILAGLAGAFFDNELDMSPIGMIGLAGLGAVYPGIWLGDRIQRRRRRIFRDLPDFLDTLRLAVDAGLDLSSALKVSVEKGRPGPLLDEMELVERDIALGRTRREAFRAFADRLGMSEINAFVLALIQADQLGASIGPILKVQAEVARTKRWQLAEVIVNKLPMKMLGPLIVFIFPASFVILFTPLVIQYFQSMD